MAALQTKLKLDSYKEEKEDPKSWSWFEKDKKRLGLMITPNQRTIYNLIKKEFNFTYPKDKDQKNWRPFKGAEAPKCQNPEPQHVIEWVSKNIEYDTDLSETNDALMPVETLAARRGTCLEYANLALTMIETYMKINDDINPYVMKYFYRPRWTVVYGKCKKEKDIYHAWISLETINNKYKYYEPQNWKTTHEELANEFEAILVYNHEYVKVFGTCTGKDVKAALAVLGSPKSWK
eukprot:107309_1